MLRIFQAVSIAAFVCALSGCTAVPYGDQLPVTPQIPPDTSANTATPVVAQCPELNTDPADTTAMYTNDDKGISFTIPYNEKWGSPGRPSPAFTEHAPTDTERLGYVLFGPPTSGAEQGLGTDCDPIQFYDLTYLPARTAASAVHTIESRGTEVVPNTTVRTINGLTVVQYTDAGLCSYPTMEVIGKKYNYSFTTSCGMDEEDEVTYLENIVKSVKLTQ